jgi:hypothetical protein
MSESPNDLGPTGQEPHGTGRSRVAAGGPVGPAGDTGEDRHLWIVEERHVTGPRGEDELEATDSRGRLWYELRPEPRGRADVLGFNYMWWLVTIFVIVLVFLPW